MGAGGALIFSFEKQLLSNSDKQRTDRKYESNNQVIAKTVPTSKMWQVPGIYRSNAINSKHPARSKRPGHYSIICDNGSNAE